MPFIGQVAEAATAWLPFMQAPAEPAWAPLAASQAMAAPARHSARTSVRPRTFFIGASSLSMA